MLLNMPQQVVVIHGGTSFDTYEAYISFLENRPLTKERLLHSDDWKASLGRALGNDFEVLLPKMPNTSNARFVEWQLWFERCLPFIDDNVILVGHSLGGIFLATYLAQHVFPKHIKALVLVAAPFSDTSTEEALTEFNLPMSLQKLTDQVSALYLLHSHDDPVVPFEQVKKYQQALPGAKLIEFTDRGHFNQEQFPEIVDLLRSIASGSTLNGGE